MSGTGWQMNTPDEPTRDDHLTRGRDTDDVTPRTNSRGPLDDPDGPEQRPTGFEQAEENAENDPPA
jgi:hypothetical protein